MPDVWQLVTTHKKKNISMCRINIPHTEEYLKIIKGSSHFNVTAEKPPGYNYLNVYSYEEKYIKNYLEFIETTLKKEEEDNTPTITTTLQEYIIKNSKSSKKTKKKKKK